MVRDGLTPIYARNGAVGSFYSRTLNRHRKDLAHFKRLNAAHTDRPAQQPRRPGALAGYRENAEATARAFTHDGWFRTGDLGYLDRDGYLHITGRAKEVIVLAGGKNVNPEDVEKAYITSPFIREIAVFERDSAIAALVVPDDDAVREYGASREEELLREEIEAVSHRLPSYQRLACYRVTRVPLPRTNLGKLRRHLLPEIFSAAVAGPKSAGEPSAADCRLLTTEPAKSVWQWLRGRFRGKHLTLDTSSQLDLHVDSLEWVAPTLEIHERFGVVLEETAIARILTLRDMLEEVSAARRGGVKLSAELGQLTAEDERWLDKTSPLMTLLGAVLFGASWLVVRLLFGLRTEGAESLPNHGPLVVAPNHASYLDPLAVAASLGFRRLKQTYWAGWARLLFHGSFRRLLSRAAHIFPLDPDRGPATALAFGSAILRRKRILVWFPEGALTATGELGRFLPGIGALVENATANVVPSLIEGTFEAMPGGLRWPRFRQIKVIFGPARGVEELASLSEGATRHQRIADGLRHAVAGLKSDSLREPL